MNRRSFAGKPLLSALVALAPLWAPLGCGAPAGALDQPRSTVAGQLVARAELGRQRAVDFYDMDGTMVMAEVGRLDDSRPQPPLDFEKLRGLTPVDRFRTLAPSTPVPAALVAAQARWSRRPHPALAPRLRPPERDSDGGGPDQLAFGSSGGQLGSTDGNQFASSFCWDQSNYMNWVWCPPFRNGGANSGEHYTMWYDTTCLNAPSPTMAFSI